MSRRSSKNAIPRITAAPGHTSRSLLPNPDRAKGQQAAGEDQEVPHLPLLALFQSGPGVVGAVQGVRPQCQVEDYPHAPYERQDQESGADVQVHHAHAVGYPARHTGDHPVVPTPRHHAFHALQHRRSRALHAETLSHNRVRTTTAKRPTTPKSGIIQGDAPWDTRVIPHRRERPGPSIVKDMNNQATRLHRPEEGRWIAGVAAGLALHLGVAAGVIRAAFALLCFVGGLGVLLYVAGWLLIPGEGETESIVQGWVGAGQARRWVGVILVGVAIIILAAETSLIRGDLAFAVVLIGIGVMLFRGDLSRGDRSPAPRRSDSPEAPPDGTAESSTAPPQPAAATTPPPPRERSYLGRVFVGVAVIALGVLGLLDEVVPGFHPHFFHYMALAMGVIGLGVVVGAWFGRPAGLVILGAVLIPVLLLSRLAEAGGVNLVSIEFTSGGQVVQFSSVGQVLHRPASVEDINESYELGVGGLIIDLRDVDFAGRTVTMDAEVGIGEIVVRLPEGVAADVSGEVGMGSLEVGDWDRHGIGVEADLHLEGSGGTLVLDSGVGIGEIEVRAWPVDDRSPHRLSEDEALEEYRIREGAELGDDYTLSDGSLRLDLGELVLGDDKRVPINVDRGEVWVTVPPDFNLRITTRVDRGRVTVFDQVWEGRNLRTTHSTGVSDAPRLTLDIRLGEGNVTVEENDETPSIQSLIADVRDLPGWAGRLDHLVRLPHKGVGLRLVPLAVGSRRGDPGGRRPAEPPVHTKTTRRRARGRSRGQSLRAGSRDACGPPVENRARPSQGHPSSTVRFSRVSRSPTRGPDRRRSGWRRHSIRPPRRCRECHDRRIRRLAGPPRRRRSRRWAWRSA